MNPSPSFFAGLRATLLAFLVSSPAPARAGAAPPPFMSEGTHYPLAGDCHSLVTGDFDGDGTADAATADGGGISIWLNEGDGRLRPAGRLLAGHPLTKSIARVRPRGARYRVISASQASARLRSSPAGAEARKAWSAWVALAARGASGPAFQAR